MLTAIATVLEALLQEGEGGKGTKERIDEAMEGVKEELKETMQKGMEELKKETGEMIKSLVETMKTNTPTGTQTTQRTTYSAVAAGALSAGNDARVVARKIIQARQIRLILGGEGGRLGPESEPKDIRKALEDTIEWREKAHKIRTVRIQGGEALVEMESEEGAEWLREEMKNDSTRKDLGAEVKGRKWQIMVKFVPITFDETEGLAEMLEENAIDPKDVQQARWMKRKERRGPGQSVAHLALTVTNEDTLNYILAKGLIIHQEWKQAEKMKQEPIRCFRCQGFGHIGKNCGEETETCGTCGDQTHETKDCTNTGKKFCKPCNKEGHCSWDRLCPTFVRKCKEYDERHPENAMPFAPTAEPWTWAAGQRAHNKLSTQQQTEIRTKPATQRGKKDTQKDRAKASGAEAQKTMEARMASIEAALLTLAQTRADEPIFAT
ncbi:hypothetical protein BKA70DRAFT_1104274 [Coprinopsis sp. MPI-PUGE-AT-0042]|nr:hypothetical protein BKA70DRAFT_1104274 [Coprinopsis sp. MPI-PUGE-AT-0042]